MKNKSLRHLTLFILLTLSGAVAARGDSIFSINGLGQRLHPLGGQARGMGGVTIAFLDGRAMSMVNPATSGAIDTTMVAGLFLYEQRRIKDSVANTTISFWGPRFFRLVIPLSHGFVAGGGIAPYSDVNFHAFKRDEALGNGYTLNVSADGGIHLGSMILATNIGNRLYLGAAVNLIFGSISETWTRDFDDPGFVDSQDRMKTSYYGQEYVGGIAVRLLPAVTAGALYSRSGQIKATEERTALSGTTETSKRDLDLPGAYGLGFTWQLHRRLILGGDIYMTQWDRFRLDGTGNPRYQNTTRFSFGGELAPSTDKTAPFYAKMPWRMGASHEPWYYEDMSGQRVSETFLTLGTSFFFKEHRGAVDLTLEVGKRGDISDNGAQEWIIRQSVTVVGWERWFQPSDY